MEAVEPSLPLVVARFLANTPFISDCKSVQVECLRDLEVERRFQFIREVEEKVPRRNTLYDTVRTARKQMVRNKKKRYEIKVLVTTYNTYDQYLAY
jgi:hypothetical protein